MGNKMIGKAVNQFIQIAGMWALVWGALGGLISVRSQSCLVVLCGRASDCVAVHMPSYFLETFTEYPYLIFSRILLR